MLHEVRPRGTAILNLVLNLVRLRNSRYSSCAEYSDLCGVRHHLRLDPIRPAKAPAAAAAYWTAALWSWETQWAPETSFFSQRGGVRSDALSVGLFTGCSQRHTQTARAARLPDCPRVVSRLPNKKLVQEILQSGDPGCRAFDIERVVWPPTHSREAFHSEISSGGWLPATPAVTCRDAGKSKRTQESNGGKAKSCTLCEYSTPATSLHPWISRARRLSEAA